MCKDCREVCFDNIILQPFSDCVSMFSHIGRDANPLPTKHLLISFLLWCGKAPTNIFFGKTIQQIH